MKDDKDLYDFVSEYIELTNPSDGIWMLYFYYRNYDVTVKDGKVTLIEKAKL